MNDLYTRAAALELSDGGTVIGRIAPFDQIVTVKDRHPDTGETTSFREVFRRGAFAKMINGLAARGWTKAVTLNIDHRSGVTDTIGYATEIVERADGAWATFSLYDGDPNLEKIKDMLRTSHDGMSVGFRDLKHRTVGDLVERLAAHIDHVAVTATPAYPGAAVALVRADDLADLSELPTPRLDALRRDLEALRA